MHEQLSSSIGIPFIVSRQGGSQGVIIDGTQGCGTPVAENFGSIGLLHMPNVEICVTG